MSKTDSSSAANSTPNTTFPDSWESIPCVQYGFPEDKGPRRTPKLHPIFEAIPDGAATASPVYLLKREQYERQLRLKKGYAVKGAMSIAMELQDECEAADRVLYPVHIESDAYHDDDPATLIEWSREFIEEYLGVSFDTCTLYFSGRRSIHAHVPRFVAGEDQREHLRDLAETFCEETGADLDCGLYDAKRMFRLPGVDHAKTGLPKVEIEPEWGHDRIFRETNNASSSVPESYESVLRSVFATQPSLTVKSPQTSLDPPYDLFQVLDSEKTVLEVTSDEQEVAVPLIEQEQCPSEASAIVEWARYNAKEFSPYALASGNSRSVSALEIKGGAFGRSEVTVGNSNRSAHALVPSYFYGARGCGGEFTKADEHAPLQLSKPDYDKWEYDAGDRVVIIGGRSRRSLIFEVEPWDATVVGHALTGEAGSRQQALDYLDENGYNVGNAGRRGVASSPPSPPTEKRSTNTAPEGRSQTAAKELQDQAEKNGIKTLTHQSQVRVACRLLKIDSWELAWQWFKQQYGQDFDPTIAHQQLQTIVSSYPEDYSHIDLPPTP